MAFDPLRLLFGKAAREDTLRAEAARSSLAGDPGERSQRLQVGFFGLAAMILLVGLANIIMNSVKETRATTVPEAAPTVVAREAPAPVRDPLADAGVVPDLPAEPDAAASPGPGGGGGARPANSATDGPSPQP